MRPGGCDHWAELLQTEVGSVAVQAFMTCEAQLQQVLHLQGWDIYFIPYDLKHVCFWFVFQITYIETSAKDPPMNVDKAFHELVRVIR